MAIGNRKSLSEHLSGVGVRELLWHGSFLGFSRIYYIAVRSIYILALADILGPTFYGQLNYAQNWYVTFLTISMLGIGDFVARETSGKSALARGRILGTATGLRLASGVVFTILVACLVMYFEAHPTLVLVTVLLTQLIFVRGLCAWADTLYIVYGNPMVLGYLAIGFITIEALGGVILALSGYGLLPIATFIVAVWWVRLGVTIIISRRISILVNLSFSFTEAKRIVRKGLLFAANSFLIGWLGTGLILLLKFQIEDSTEFGNIALVIQLTLILASVSELALRPALPLVTRCVERKDGKELIYLSVLSRTVIFLGGSVWFFCLYATEPILSQIVGGNYTAAVNVLAWCLFLLIPSTIHTVCVQVLIAYGFYRPIILASLSGVIVFAILLSFIESSGSYFSMILCWACAFLVVMSVSAISCTKIVNFRVIHDLFLPLAILMIVLVIPFVTGVSEPHWQFLVRIASLGVAFCLYYLTTSRAGLSDSSTAG